MTKSVWREWRTAETDSIALLLKSANPAALEIARAAAERVNELAAETALEGGVRVSPMPKGTGVTIADCDDLEPALTAFTDALTELGIGEATLTLLPAVRHVARGGRSGIESHWIRAMLTIRATPPPENTLASLAEHRWSVTAEDIEVMLRWAWDFCLAVPGGAVNAEIGVNDRDILVAVEQVLPMLRTQAVDRRANRMMWPRIEIKGRDGRFRVAVFDFVYARASVAAGVDAADYDWAANLADMTQVLLGAPVAVSQGVLAGGTNDDVYGLTTMHPDAPWGGEDPWLSDLAMQRGVEDEQALDAFGIMMVPASFAHLMPNGPDWTIEHHGERILLRWHDPADWFTRGTLPDGLLPRARATLGPLVAENNPPGSNNRFPPARSVGSRPTGGRAV